MPRLQPEGLPMISLGGLWLCLWRGPCGAGAWSRSPPDSPHDADQAARYPDRGRRALRRRTSPRRHYLISADKGEKIVRSLFASETGEALTARPASGSEAESGLDCAGELCV
jgi:hypothetical protein